ncbi:MAG TPA: glutaredoxin family protein [Patescibacteria group bacterium]
MNIKIYSTPTCPYCKLAKEFFNSKNLKFSDIDVSADPGAANEMIEKSGQMGVPVIEIDGQIIIGFNQQKLQEIIGGSN